MKDGLKVAVIIPTYKRSDNLCRAIDSVLSQTYPEIEVVIVDDNGEDSHDQKATYNQIIGYLANPKIKYIVRVKNGGGAEARNTGIENSNADVITFLDDDDIYYKNKIELQLAHLQCNDLDISLCSMHVISDGFNHTPGWSHARGISVKDYILNGNSFTPMIMIRKITCEQFNGFTDTKMLQDHIFVLKALAVSNRIGVIDIPLFSHVVHKGERVSHKLSFDSLNIKHSLENCLANKNAFTIKEMKMLKFKHLSESSLMHSRKGECFLSLKYVIGTFGYIYDGRSFVNFLKLSFRVFIGPKLFENIQSVKLKIKRKS